MAIKHVIADSRQRAGSECHTVCTCGERMTGDTPEVTAEAFIRHRRDNGLRNNHRNVRVVEPTVWRIKRRVYA